MVCASLFFGIIERGKCRWNSAIIINIYIAHLYGKIHTLVSYNRAAIEIYNVDMHGGIAFIGNGTVYSSLGRYIKREQ